MKIFICPLFASLTGRRASPPLGGTPPSPRPLVGCPTVRIGLSRATTHSDSSTGPGWPGSTHDHARTEPPTRRRIAAHIAVALSAPCPRGDGQGRFQATEGPRLRRLAAAAHRTHRVDLHVLAPLERRPDRLPEPLRHVAQPRLLRQRHHQREFHVRATPRSLHDMWCRRRHGCVLGTDALCERRRSEAGGVARLLRGVRQPAGAPHRPDSR